MNEYVWLWHPKQSLVVILRCLSWVSSKQFTPVWNRVNSKLWVSPRDLTTGRPYILVTPSFDPGEKPRRKGSIVKTSPDDVWVVRTRVDKEWCWVTPSMIMTGIKYRLLWLWVCPFMDLIPIHRSVTTRTLYSGSNELKVQIHQFVKGPWKGKSSTGWDFGSNDYLLLSPRRLWPINSGVEKRGEEPEYRCDIKGLRERQPTSVHWLSTGYSTLIFTKRRWGNPLEVRVRYRSYLH